AKGERWNCRRAGHADADQKDQRTDRSRAACDWMARTRRGKIRKKAYPASRADRPSSPKSPGCQSSRESQRRANREPFFNEIRAERKIRHVHASVAIGGKADRDSHNQQAEFDSTKSLAAHNSIPICASNEIE